MPLHRLEMKVFVGNVLMLMLLSATPMNGNPRYAGGVSQSDLRCLDARLHPVPGSCSEYYECKKRGDSYYPTVASCLPGEVFDDVFLECRVEPFITSPSHCISTDTVTGRTDEESSTLSTVIPATVETNGTVVTADENLSGNITSVSEVSAVPAGGNVTEPDTGIPEEFFGDAQDLNATLTNETLTVNGTATTIVVDEITLCEHVGIVDSFVTLVISSPTLKESFEHQKYYNGIFRKYNLALSKAQNDTFQWRNGESILGLLKTAYQKASVFGIEFNRKHEINQERMKTLSEQSHSETFIEKLKADIKKLEEEIKDTEQILSVTDVLPVRQYFLNSINSKRQEIEKKQKEVNQSSKVSLELEEIIPFIEFARGDANSVEILARDSTDQLVTLNEDLERDFVSFERQASLVSAGIQALESEEESYESSLVQNRAEIQKLEIKKADMNEEMSRLTDINGRNLQELRDLTDQMEEKTQAFYLEKERYCNAPGLVRSWLESNASAIERERECNAVLKSKNIYLDLSEERNQSMQLQAESARNREVISKILAKLRDFDQKILALLSAEPHTETRLQQVSAELARLQTHFTDLENLQLGITSAKSSLLEVISEFQELHVSFEVITKQFDMALAQGTRAGDDQEKLSAKQEMEQTISDVQIKVEQMLLPDLERCI